MSQFYKNYKVLIQLTWYYFGVEKRNFHTMMVGTLMELALACTMYGVLPMRLELNLRVLTTLAALINWPELHQCEHT